MKILSKNGVDNTNIDSARFNSFCAGQRNGIVKGALNECEITSPSSSVLNINTGELLISGIRVVINNAIQHTFSTMPNVPIRYSLVAEISIDNNSEVTSRVFVQSVAQLIQEDLFKTETGAGVYQVELAKFTLTKTGLEDLVRTIDIITGSKSGGGSGQINIGTVETETLAEGLEAEVDIEEVFNSTDNKYYVDFNFHIPKGDTGKQGIQGIQGLTGNGITKVEKTSTSGIVDTYTITFTDSTTATFTVTNGAKGDTGNGISSIEKSGTVGAVDTYIINFTNGTTTSFQITNGEVTLAQMNSAIQSAIYDSWGGSY